jgi:hypothetical protein
MPKGLKLHTHTEWLNNHQWFHTGRQRERRAKTVRWNQWYAGPRHSSNGWSLATHRGGLGSSPGLVMWDLWWTKCRWGRFSPSTSVSPANFHPTSCSTITVITWGWYNRPIVAALPSGLSLSPLNNNNNNNLKQYLHSFTRVFIS